MEEFKNSFYRIATAIAGSNAKIAQGQLSFVDNFTSDAPMLKGIPFQQASHSYHHAYGDIVGVDGMQEIDLDAPLPTMMVDTQLKSVPLKAFGGAIKFGEDLMKKTHGTPDAYLSAQIPALLRDSGARLETTLYTRYLLEHAIQIKKAIAGSEGVAGQKYGTMVAVTWNPNEMIGLYSPLPYNGGSDFGAFFRPEWANGKNRHDLGNGVYGYAATIKTLIGFLMANTRKISAIVNIDGTPTPLQLASFVNAAQGGNGTGNTRIYCAPALRTSIAASYAQQFQGNGLVAVSSSGDVSIQGVPVVTSYNIPMEYGRVTDVQIVA